MTVTIIALIAIAVIAVATTFAALRPRQRPSKKQQSTTGGEQNILSPENDPKTYPAPTKRSLSGIESSVNMGRAGLLLVSSSESTVPEYDLSIPQAPLTVDVDANKTLTIRDGAGNSFLSSQVSASESVNDVFVDLADYKATVQGLTPNIYNVLRTDSPSFRLFDTDGTQISIDSIDDSANPTFDVTLANIPLQVNSGVEGALKLGWDVFNIILEDPSGATVTPDSIDTGTAKQVTIELPNCDSFPTIRFSQKPDSRGTAEFDAYALNPNFFKTEENHYYGHDFRFCSKLGYTDGTNYFLHDGSASNKATVFADGYMIDMQTYIPSDERALAMKLTPESSATGGAHRSSAASFVFAGIGPNRWFMWNFQIYSNLSTFDYTSTQHLNYPPLDLASGSSDRYFFDNQNGQSTLHYLRVLPYDSTVEHGGNSSTQQSFYCCWFDLQND